MSDADLSALLVDCGQCPRLINVVVNPQNCPECNHPVDREVSMR